MKLVSLAYFLAFGIFVPLASYMIVYGLYLLRVYMFERVSTEGVHGPLLRLAVADLYKKMRTKVGSRRASDERRSERIDSHVINIDRRSTDQGTTSRRSSTVSPGMEHNLLLLYLNED